MRLQTRTNLPALVSLTLSFILLMAPVAFAQQGGAPASEPMEIDSGDGPNQVGDPLLPLTFSNPTTITITDTAAGNPEPAAPYPSNIIVPPGVGNPTSVRVRLNNLTHTSPDDLDIMLVGPGGATQSLMIMSDAGGGTDVNNVTLTFDDAAAAGLPDSGGFATGTYKPTDWDATPPTCGAEDGSFPAPAPPAPAFEPQPCGTSTLNGVFGTAGASGTWSLYVSDDANMDSGMIAGGWDLLLDAPITPAGLNDVKISEFRLRGPNGATDEFIELYNNTDSTIFVNDALGGTGWALVSADAPTVPKAIIPTGQSIPARGHYLITNSGGYSLGGYPSGNNGTTTTLATADFSYTTDIPDNRGIALFRTSIVASFVATERLDAVGPASEANVIYKEGTGLPDIATTALQYSWARRLPGGCTGSNPGFVNHNCTTATLIENTPAPTSGAPQDSANNVTDFIFVEVNGAVSPAGNQRLGAPGPENKTSPVVRGNPNGSGTINPTVVDPMQSSRVSPNRERDTACIGPPNTCGPNSTFGTLDVRRRFTNNTGMNVTRLRFRLMDISTFPNPAGTADIRARTSGDVVVNLTGGGGTATVRGTTLEEPPTQPNGGAYNSTLSTGPGIVTLAQPLLPGASVNVRFFFGVQATGKFRVFVTVEALP